MLMNNLHVIGKPIQMRTMRMTFGSQEELQTHSNVEHVGTA